MSEEKITESAEPVDVDKDKDKDKDVDKDETANESTNKTANEPVIKEKEKDSSMLILDQLHENINNPPPIPGFDILTIEPQMMMVLGKLVKLLNDDTLYKNVKDLIFAKINVKVASAQNELKKITGGGPSYFTEEDCSFTSSLSSRFRSSE
jgi:hypothetical protein